MNSRDHTSINPEGIIEYLNDMGYLEDLMGNDLVIRCEIRRLLSWFSGDFYYQVLTPLLVERSLGRILGRGAPDSRLIRSSFMHLIVLDRSQFVFPE